jgi:hypothetical protein
MEEKMRNLLIAAMALVTSSVSAGAEGSWLNCGDLAAQYHAEHINEQKQDVTIWVVRTGKTRRPYANGIELPGMVFDVEYEGTNWIFNGFGVTSILLNRTVEELGAPVTWDEEMRKVPQSFSLNSSDGQELLNTFNFVGCGQAPQ